MSDSIFQLHAPPHDGLARLPAPPPWRQVGTAEPPTKPDHPTFDLEAEQARGAPFRLTEPVVRAVNAALLLRRPLLVTGKPGVGKSSLAYAVAYQLRLGPVLKWPITSRSTVKSGLYEYDAVGRLQDPERGALGSYFRLGPLGSALHPTSWPRVLLVDEIDKGDLDLPNDLLNVLEDGEFEIPELQRASKARAAEPRVRVRLHGDDEEVEIADGRVRCQQFPFIVMTSNGEREFPAPFLRRCIRLTIPQPTFEQLRQILEAHVDGHLRRAPADGVTGMIHEFLQRRQTQELATDQLLAAALLLFQGDHPPADQESVKANEDFQLLVKQLSGAESS